MYVSYTDRAPEARCGRSPGGLCGLRGTGRRTRLVAPAAAEHEPGPQDPPAREPVQDRAGLHRRHAEQPGGPRERDGGNTVQDDPAILRAVLLAVDRCQAAQHVVRH